MYTYKCINAWVSVGCTTVKETSYCNTYVCRGHISRETCVQDVFAESQSESLQILTVARPTDKATDIRYMYVCTYVHLVRMRVSVYSYVCNICIRMY